MAVCMVIVQNIFNLMNPHIKFIVIERHILQHFLNTEVLNKNTQNHLFVLMINWQELSHIIQEELLLDKMIKCIQ